MAETEEKSLLYQKYNYDNVFNRSVIAGLLYLLNHRLTYEQVWDDNVVETVTIPFAYNFVHAKDQRFAQDNYTFFGRECVSDKLVDGKFDRCPRFMLTYTGSQIESANITNRFVKGTYMKDENGKLTSYTAFMYSIPLNMSFELEGWIDTLETAFKIEQAIRDTFYKNQTFNVLYRGMKIGCRVGFPEQYTVGEKTVSYSFEQDSQLIKMSFSLSVEAYQPCFDESVSIPSENKIEGFGFDSGVYNAAITPKTRKVSIKMNGIDTSRPYSVGEKIHISWDTSSNNSDVSSVIVYYVTDDGDTHMIKCITDQNGFYDWTVPQFAAKSKGPSVYVIGGTIFANREPIITAVPNVRGYIDSGSFFISDGGLFSGDGYVQVSCEYVDKNGKNHISDCYVGVVENGSLSEVMYYKDVPDCEDFGMANPKKLKYGQQVGSRISIGVSYPLDTDIKDEIHNVLII